MRRLRAANGGGIPACARTTIRHAKVFARRTALAAQVVAGRGGVARVLRDGLYGAL